MNCTQEVARPRFRDEIGRLLAGARGHHNRVLPIGLGRSYGDSGLNAGGRVIDMRGLDRFIAFDATTGVIEAEAGATLAQIIDFALPLGFFPPVTPGTQQVTLGGAIANDVHGKNHHSAGTFARCVREITLLRSDGIAHILGPEDQLFAATVGGLGLTGVILSAKLQLKPVSSAEADVRNVSFANLQEFFALDRELAGRHEYSVAWIDCLASGASLGRGLYSAADHVEDGDMSERKQNSRARMPLDLPGFALNRFSVGAFNALKHRLGRMRAGRTRRDLIRYLYPLDAIGDWNRGYGRRGLYQHQCVVAPDHAEAAIAEMLQAVAKSGQGSPLAVLKAFGNLSSPGLLSFPKEGTTLALDFPNRGEETVALLHRLDAIVNAAGGRIYPAKDGVMSAQMFRDGYPRLDEFATHVDGAMSSSFWRRMQG